jgi:hypothetical protein
MVAHEGFLPFLAPLVPLFLGIGRIALGTVAATLVQRYAAPVIQRAEEAFGSIVPTLAHPTGQQNQYTSGDEGDYTDEEDGGDDYAPEDRPEE